MGGYGVVYRLDEMGEHLAVHPPLNEPGDVHVAVVRSLVEGPLLSIPDDVRRVRKRGKDAVAVEIDDECFLVQGQGVALLILR